MWSAPANRHNFDHAGYDHPSKGSRVSAPQPARCACIGNSVCRPMSIMPDMPTPVRLTITQVPPQSRTKSCRLRISSISPVRLKATIAFLPVLSAAAFTARIVDLTRSSKGHAGPSACNSSSLIKSIPPAHRSVTSAPVASADRPTLGLMIVPINGRSGTPARARVPWIPNFGPT